MPVLFFLAGLTCTEETFAIKAGAQRFAAQHGLMLVTPDTSPRDTGVAGADADWDFGNGAGFYLDATSRTVARPLAHGELRHAASCASWCCSSSRRAPTASASSAIRWAGTAR